MSSYIRLEILLFFRAFETGVGMLGVYRLTDMLKRRLFCDRMWNSTVDILYWLLAGLLLFTDLYQCNYGRHTKRRLWCNRRGRRFEKVKKEKK